MRHLAAVLLMVCTGGCATLGGGSSSTLLVNTSPPGALVSIDSYGECESPCTVRLDRPRQARIAKAGFISATVTLAPGRKSVTIPLELAAASDDVDAVALPDLN